MMMTFCLRRFWRNESGQDLIEYALMAALMATTLGVVMPGWIFPQLSHIYSQVTSSLSLASGS
jgi:Flp pilus assembly pilin Flp